MGSFGRTKKAQKMTLKPQDLLSDDFSIFLEETKTLVLPGLEPGTFRVWSERDNHYTTELQQQLCKKINDIA